MENPLVLPAAQLAERVVRHFQREGFVGISEALVLRIRLRHGDRAAVDAAFEAAAQAQEPPPLGQWFEINAVGHYSDFRGLAEATAAIARDFTSPLRHGVPRLYFEAAPVVIDDPLATDTKYDAMVKLSANVGGHAFAILLNDPDASFLDYLGTHHGADWHQVMGDFEAAAIAFTADGDLL